MKTTITIKTEKAMMPENILIVDDEKEIADLVEVYLQNENYTVYKFYSARCALDCINNTDLDLAILDIMLPEMDGFTLLRKIRERHTYPVIMLTARDEQADKINGLTLGADDYVTKPFLPLELVARVKAQLRRYKKYNLSQNEAEKPEELIHGALVLNTRTHECTLNQSPLSLTPTEFSILRILLEKEGTVVSSEDLFHQIWQEEYYIKSNNTITVHIRHLREKMHDTGDRPKYIKTVWGVGYKIEAQK